MDKVGLARKTMLAAVAALAIGTATAKEPQTR